MNTAAQRRGSTVRCPENRAAGLGRVDARDLYHNLAADSGLRDKTRAALVQVEQAYCLTSANDQRCHPSDEEQARITTTEINMLIAA